MNSEEGKSTSNESSSSKDKRRRGRKPSRLDHSMKLERSRQSAKACRQRKKLRYEYLEELVTDREKAIYHLREELEAVKKWSKDMDSGKMSAETREIVREQCKLRRS